MNLLGEDDIFDAEWEFPMGTHFMNNQIKQDVHFTITQKIYRLLHRYLGDICVI